MVVHNNKDILMVPYEDLPDEDKDIISKAIQEFQNKCLLSYAKTYDNKVIQKYLLPRVLIHGQSDTAEADDRHFFVDVVNKSVHNAMLNHNTTFLNIFHNTMKEVFYGFPLDQVGPAYYNIPHPSTQGTNHAGTSQQGAALAKDDDIQAIQNSSEQVQDAPTNQMQYNHGSSVQHVQQPTGQVQNHIVNFGTSG
jgi:hypothetical protein